MERAAEIADDRCIDHAYAIAQAIRVKPMDMVERVSLAMWLDHVDLQGYPNGCPTWDEMLLMPSEQGVVEEVRSNAKAAIRAMLDGQEPVAWRYVGGTHHTVLFNQDRVLSLLVTPKPRSTISAR